MSAHAALAEPRWAPATRLAALRPGAGVWLGVAGGAALAGIAFGASGGLSLAQTTTVEMILTLASGLALAAAIVAAPARLLAHGGPSVAILGALGILTAVSVSWSLDPSSSWLEASRTATYAFVFAAAVAGARLLGHRWASVLGAVILAGVVVSGYALATKVFPNALDSTESYARLRAPYGYWNAIGLTAAMAVLPCLWLGARRSGHAAVNALAYPALGVLFVTIMLAYSRGALLALAVAGAFWFATVPLRLRGVAVLATCAAGAAGPVAWAFSRDALTRDKVDLALRTDAGHQLGILLIAMVVLLTVAGLAVGFFTDRRTLAPATRRTIGTAILVALALVPVGLGTALAFSSRGLGGSLSHDWKALTDPHARTPPNDPSRLTAVGSVRARYWNEALKIFSDHYYIGAGAGAYGLARLHYRQDTLDVQHAHGYVVQTLADLGLLGMAVSLLALAAWALAAARSAAPGGWRPRPLGSTLAAWGRRIAPGRAPPRPDAALTEALEPVSPEMVAEFEARGRGPRALPYTPERIGLLTLMACVIVFGVHSAIDWTWFVPGNACVGLLCAGWLAGRGPFESSGALGRARLPGTPAWLAPPAGLPGAGRWRSELARLASGARLRARTLDPGKGVAAALILLAAAVVAWSQWQPLRSANAGDDALAAAGVHDYARARALAHTADQRDPVSVDPLFDLAVIETAAGDRLAAHRALDRAVRRQPANPQTWTRLAEFDYTQLNNPTAALNNLRPALYLDPRSYQVEGEVLAVVRRLAMPNPPPATAPSATTPPTATPPTTAPPTATPPSTATP